MNLQQFIDYRKTCPICNQDLKLVFHSQRQQIYKYENDRIIFLFNLNPIKKGQRRYKVGYSFGLKDNSYYIEFYNKDENRFENDVPDFLRKRFLEFNHNLLLYKFFKYCNCRNYNYSSDDFNLYPYNKTTIPYNHFDVYTEYIGLSQPIEGGLFKVYKLLNNYEDKRSLLSFGKSHYDWISEFYSKPNIMTNKLEFIDLPLIKFISKQETTDRLNKLILFS